MHVQLSHPRTAAPQLNSVPEDFEAQIATFAPRKELPQVRGLRAKIQEQLANAIDTEDYTSAALLRDDLAELKQKDPATVAAALREELEAHVRKERYDDAARCRDELLVLRRFLPQYQLAGLWKGNYPNHGDEFVRLHYQGDQLFATKITGDEHVPAGEITFQADLAAPADLWEELGGPGRGLNTPSSDGAGVRVEVLALSADGGHEPREVEQFHGQGRIAARGFRHPHFVPGQLFLMDDDVIGFLWLPIGTFVVLSRVPEDEELSAKTSVEAAVKLGLTSQLGSELALDDDDDVTLVDEESDDHTES